MFERILHANSVPTDRAVIEIQESMVDQDKQLAEANRELSRTRLSYCDLFSTAFPAVGPVMRLELNREDESELIEAELTRERFQELDLQQGELVFVKPRNLRVFLSDMP